MRLILSSDDVLHSFFVDVFDQMALDRPVKHPFISRQIGDFTVIVYPRYDTTESDDPIMKRLNGVRCKDYPDGAGIAGRTMIRINMYGWNGTRGVYLARKVADLSRRGCDIQVLESSAGGKVVRILANNGVQIKTPDLGGINNSIEAVLAQDPLLDWTPPSTSTTSVAGAGRADPPEEAERFRNVPARPVPVSNVPARNPHFTGRTGMLEELRQTFEARGFLEGSHSEPGHFVIEKAFVER